MNMKDKFGMEIPDDEFIDDRSGFEKDIWTVLHQIRDRVRECEKNNIEYEPFIDFRDLTYVVDCLDCCLEQNGRIE